MVVTAPTPPAAVERQRPSPVGIVLVLAIGVVVSLAGGSILQAGFAQAKGHLLVHESDARLRIVFDYPIYDDVKRFQKGTDYESLEVSPAGENSGAVVYESKTTKYDNNIQLSVTIEHNDSAFALDYDRDHCRTGPEVGTEDEGARAPVVVTADFAFRTIHGVRAAICRTAIRYPDEPDGDKLQLITTGDYAFGPNRIADVQAITYGPSLSRQQRSIVDAVISSVRPR